MLSRIFSNMIDNNVLGHLVQYFLIPTLAVVFFIFFLLINKSFRTKIIRVFILSAITIFLLIIADAGEYYYSLFDSPHFMRYLFACSGYALRVMILYFTLFLYFVDSNVKIKITILIPAILNFIISFLSLIPEYREYGLSYTETNEIVRGPLILVPFITSLFYFFIFFVISIGNYKRGNKKEIIIIALIFLFSIITTLLELFLRYKGLLTGSSIFCLIFYYIYLLLSNYSVDQLTGAYVRFKLYNDINSLDNYSIIIFDVNDLKSINDSKGHLEGDKCLQIIVADIRKNIHLTDNVYRMGGDEFVAILKTNKLENVMEIARDIRNDVSNDGYSIAIGYSIKDSDDDFENLLKQADTMLYSDKDYYKSQKK